MERSIEEERLGVLWRTTRPQRARPQCFNSTCTARSAKNHLLMQNGILSELTGNGRHVRELRTNRFRSSGNYYSFERVGWDNALTMYGYCSVCDHRLFASIEGMDSRIPDAARSASRYGLRPVLHELRKKEGNLKFFAELPPEKFPNWLPRTRENTLAGERHAIKFLTRLHAYLIKAASGKAPLNYVVRRSPRLEVCASSALIRPIIYSHVSQRSSLPKSNPSTPSVNILNVFPKGNELVTLSIAMPYDLEGVRFNTEIVECSDADFLRLLSNVLVSHIEDWAVSEELFLRMPTGIEGIITHAKSSPHLFYVDQRVNLFA